MMAECVGSEYRVEWLTLLQGLKATVEGLLAMQSCNVWSAYGGLPRLCNCVQAILNHRLKVTQGQYGSCLDYWNFVRGLRWLNPVMLPSIEQLTRVSPDMEGLCLSPGEAWVRQSLLNHNLRTQLEILVSNRQHLLTYYEDDAFLAQSDYFAAAAICLQAVEQNDAALLAEVNPTLLSTTVRKKKKVKLKIQHARSISLPVNRVSETIMIRRARTEDHLAPPMSPKSHTVLSASREYALPRSGSSPESAKEALLQVLTLSGTPLDFDDVSPPPQARPIDPLMQLEVYPTNCALLHRSSLTNIHTLGRTSSAKSRYYKSNMRRSVSVQLNSNSNNLDSDDKDKENLRSRASSKSSDLLDRILNEDDWIKEEEEEGRGNRGKGKKAICDKTLKKQSESCQDLCSSITDRSVSKDSGISSIPASESFSNSPQSQPKDVEPSASTPRKRYTHHRSASDFALPGRPPQEHEPPRRMSCNSPSEALSSSLPDRESKTAASDGFLTQPQEGQSLMSFLSSQDFHTCADLDKENAHFSISEALIAAIEQMKWNRIIRPQNDSEEGESDEEIQQLRQRIRIRKRERMIEKARGFPAFSDGRTDTTPTTSSTSPLESSFYSSGSQDDSSEASDEDVHDAEINEDGQESTSSLSTLKESGLSLSLASLYSDADLLKNQQLSERRDTFPEKTDVYMEVPLISAESVAINLLKKFSEKQLPKASDLQWLVSEQDAPQRLLPLPNSYPVSPDEGENADLLQAAKRTRLRGNLDWAPPRAQIIFNIHPPPKRKVVLAKQNYRCAGCGAKVEPGYMKRYRYCEYLGKYFCPRCHNNAMAYIPGRILRKWDFTKYAVSKFAADLLMKIHDEPLFNVQDINQSLYRKVRALEQVRECRVQLGHLRLFLQTCRMGIELYEELQRCRNHWFEDHHMYSISELVSIKNAGHLDILRCLVNDCITHISQCPLCQAKGFICELCPNNNDILFPFELHRVYQCPLCHSCYHKDCFVPDKCPRCIRIEARKFRLSQQSPEHISEGEEGPADTNGNTET